MSQLRLQLRDAAEREAQRGPVRRAAATARASGTRPLLAATALAALAVCVTLAVGALRQPSPAVSRPHVVARLDLTSGGGDLAPGFGAVWATDPGVGEVLRVAPESGRLLARIRVGGEPHAIAVGAGAVWVYDFAGARLLRIDPATGRVTGRLRLGLPPRGDAGLAVVGGRLWAADDARLLRIDPTGRRIDRRVTITAGGLEAVSVTPGDGRLFVLRRDGRLVSYDGATGARVSVVDPGAPIRWLGPAGRSVIVGLDAGLAAVDPRTGGTVWTSRIAAKSVDDAEVEGPTVWAHGTRASGRDAVWRLDARTGRASGTVTLPEFGVSALAAVDNRLWVLTPGGRLQIVSG